MSSVDVLCALRQFIGTVREHLPGYTDPDRQPAIEESTMSLDCPGFSCRGNGEGLVTFRDLLREMPPPGVPILDPALLIPLQFGAQPEPVRRRLPGGPRSPLRDVQRDLAELQRRLNEDRSGRWDALRWLLEGFLGRALFYWRWDERSPLQWCDPPDRPRQVPVILVRWLPVDNELLNDLRRAAEAGSLAPAKERWLPVNEARAEVKGAGFRLPFDWFTRDAEKNGVMTRPRQLPGNHQREVEMYSLGNYLLQHPERREEPAAEPGGNGNATGGQEQPPPRRKKPPRPTVEEIERNKAKAREDKLRGRSPDLS